jgi:DNA-binding beta-propeller fold protein YncE
MRSRWCVPVAATAALALSAPADARVHVEVIAKGLDNPRHVAVGKDAVYVAEAGRGGDHATSKSCFNASEGFACTGATGAVTKISGQRQVRIASKLASFAAKDGGDAFGPHGVFADGDTVYFTNGGPSHPTRGTPPELIQRETLADEEPVSKNYGRLFAVPPGGGLKAIADLWAYERDANPDAGVGNPNVEINSNAVDVLVDRGRFVIVDAGGNDLLRTDASGKLKTLSVFPFVMTDVDGESVPVQSVPTGVVRGPDGFYYISELTGQPFPVGGAKVYRVDPRTGKFTTFAKGFTNVLDLDFAPDGTLYVLELDHDSLVGPGSDGGLYAVSRSGKARRVKLPRGTLTYPSGLAIGRDGTFYISNRSREAGKGEVLKLRLQ